MQALEISKAIRFLKPTAQFVLRDGDYSTVEWHELEGDAPTFDEIEQGWIAYQAKIEADKAEQAAKRTAAEAKLATLGLTADDLKALGLA